MSADNPAIKGRGASSNPANRFEELRYELDEDAGRTPDAPKTLFFRDSTRTILAHNDSPDISFDASLNPYRGCEHGCIYCYARPTHEYLGFSAGLDFESRILVKEDAPELLKKELSSASYKPQVIAISGVTDPYQPVERAAKLTRRCLEVLAECRNPVAIVTKNHLVTRDADLLAELARFGAAAVFLSVTTLDTELARELEPRASTPQLRLDAISELARAGVPTGVMVAPVIMGLTDHEMPAIIKAAAEAGASTAAYVPLRLPHGVAGLFERWLEQRRPLTRGKVLHQIQSLRGGKLNDPRFGSRMRGEGKFADHLKALFSVSCKQAGLKARKLEFDTKQFRRPRGPQLELF